MKDGRYENDELVDLLMSDENFSDTKENIFSVELKFIEIFIFDYSGNVNDDSFALLYRLNRTLPPGPDPVKLFAQNFDVELWNSDC